MRQFYSISPTFRSQLNRRLHQIFHAFQDYLIEIESRNEIKRLLKLEPTQLGDMGLLRRDVYAALRLPLRCNAGKHLEHQRARARHAFCIGSAIWVNRREERTNQCSDQLRRTNRTKPSA